MVAQLIQKMQVQMHVFGSKKAMKHSPSVGASGDAEPALQTLPATCIGNRHGTVGKEGRVGQVRGAEKPAVERKRGVDLVND